MMLFGIVRNPTMRDVITAIEPPRLPLNLAVERAALVDRGPVTLVTKSLLFAANDFTLRFIVTRGLVYPVQLRKVQYARSRFLLY